MRLAEDLKRDWKTAKSVRLPWKLGLLLAIGSALSAAIFDHFGRLELVLPALNSLVVLGYTIAVKRRLWKFLWFWIVMGVIAATHVPLIALVPWTSTWVPPLTIAAIDAVDFCLILVTISVIAEFHHARQTS